MKSPPRPTIFEKETRRAQVVIQEWWTPPPSNSYEGIHAKTGKRYFVRIDPRKRRRG